MKVQNLNSWPVDTPTGVVAPGAIVEADELSPHLSEVVEQEPAPKARKTSKSSQEGSK